MNQSDLLTLITKLIGIFYLGLFFVAVPTLFDFQSVFYITALFGLLLAFVVLSKFTKHIIKFILPQNEEKSFNFQITRYTLIQSAIIISCLVSIINTLIFYPAVILNLIVSGSNALNHFSTFDFIYRVVTSSLLIVFSKKVSRILDNLTK
jgi:uncharacterized membrane protein